MTETNCIDLIQYITKIKSNNNKLLWKLENDLLYNKFTQYISLNESVNLKTLENNNNIIDIKKEKNNNIINDENKQTGINDDNNLQEIVKKNIDNNNVELFENKTESSKPKSKIKKKLPLELLSTELNLIITDDAYNYIKTKITKLLEDKKYIKVFGVKKTAEIVSGIVNNKWNISLVLFMSFLLDKKFIYLKKEILFNKELISYNTITI